MTISAGAATALGVVPLHAVYASWRWLWFTWVALAAVVAAHLVARGLRLPRMLVPLAGMLGLFLYLTVVFVPEHAFLGVVPTRASTRNLWLGVLDGLTDVRDLAAPVPATTALVLLTAGAVGLLAIVVDLAAVTFSRPAAAGLALLALYAVPASIASNGVSWPLFVVGALGYLLLLMVEGRDRLLRWGRPVSAGAPGDSAAEEESPPLALTGQRIGLAALAIAVITPVLVPGLSTNALSTLTRTGPGDGTGTGGVVLNPFTSLKGQLNQPQPRKLFEATVPPNVHYLRTKVLERYTPAGWVQDPRSGGDSATGGLSLPAGENRSNDEIVYGAKITLTDSYRDDALPTLYAPLRISGLPDGWKYDSNTAVVYGRRIRPNGETYTLTGFEPNPSVHDLELTNALPSDSPIMKTWGIVPPKLPPEVRSTVEEVVADKSSPYGKARALSDFFSDGSRNFSYALNTVQGNSGSALVDFLTRKQGYCEQYASAMAVMLRVAGVPSRVVLGYFPHQQTSVAGGQLAVLTSDAHAWVEAYFDGIGWVTFDPTPATGNRQVDLPYAPHLTLPPVPTGSTTSSTPTASGHSGTGRLDPNDVAGSTPGGGGSSGLLTPRTALTALGVLALLALLLAPGVGRRLGRRRRLRTAAGPDPFAAARAAWDEVLASATDFGSPVPAADTPRSTASRLAREHGFGSPAIAGVRLVALAEERSRYAPEAGVEGDLATAVRAVQAGLWEAAAARLRWRAVLAPRSTLQAVSTGFAIRAANASASMGRLVRDLSRAVPSQLRARRARP